MWRRLEFVLDSLRSTQILRGHEAPGERYIAYALKDYRELHRRLWSRSRYPETKFIHTFELSDDLHFEFRCRRGDTEGLHTFSTLGSLIAIDDFLLRALCNSGFYSKSLGKVLWDGCHCIWFTEDTYQPDLRVVSENLCKWRIPSHRQPAAGQLALFKTITARAGAPAGA